MVFLLNISICSCWGPCVCKLQILRTNYIFIIIIVTIVSCSLPLLDQVCFIFSLIKLFKILLETQSLLPRYVQEPRQLGAKPASWELNTWECKGLSNPKYHPIPPKMHISRKLEFKVELGLHCRQPSGVLTTKPNTCPCARKF